MAGTMILNVSIDYYCCKGMQCRCAQKSLSADTLLIWVRYIQRIIKLDARQLVNEVSIPWDRHKTASMLFTLQRISCAASKNKAIHLAGN